MILSTIFAYAAIFFSVLFIAYFKNYLKAVYVALFKVCGPPAVPILGNVLLIKDGKRLDEIAVEMSKLYGPVTRFWISIIPCFLLVEPSHLQTVLSNNKYTGKSFFYACLHNLIGPGLVSNSGDRWKISRKAVQPYFNTNYFELFFETFVDGAALLAEDLKKLQDGNVTKFVNQCVLHILQEVVLGIPVKENMENSPFRGGPFSFPYRITRPWMLLDDLFNATRAGAAELKQKLVLQDYIRKILEKKKQQIKQIGVSSEKTSLMDMFLEASQKNPLFTEDAIVNELATFMLAGQDSVAGALAFTLYFIAKHQDVQDKIVKEMTEIFGTTDRKPTFGDVGEMKYLEQCVKESLRLCPTVPIISRRLPEEVTFGKVTLPEGATIVISPYATHRLPHVFLDPLRFDPDRFSSENLSKIHPYAYIPFSAGPRNCIGHKFALIELKTVVSSVLRCFQLSLTPGHEDLKVSYGISLRAKGGIWLRMKQRNIV